MDKDTSCHDDGPQTLILHVGLTRQKRYSLSLDHVSVYNLNKKSRFKSQFFVAELGLMQEVNHWNLASSHICIFNAQDLKR
jgi:hypothetical protein